MGLPSMGLLAGVVFWGILHRRFFWVTISGFARTYCRLCIRYIIGPQHFDLPSWESSCFVHNCVAAKAGYILKKESKQAQFKKKKANNGFAYGMRTYLLIDILCIILPVVTVWKFIISAWDLAFLISKILFFDSTQKAYIFTQVTVLDHRTVPPFPHPMSVMYKTGKQQEIVKIQTPRQPNGLDL